ncbi:YitT family protein [Clostridium lacusfryxellense]|uniref:YitT family protein n=1 Tax=Clostridium lacusfryxellense TaxID=205328 RepID=UPI001C0AD768|nr:YitT family protein [Clostridium lacusfryxellense]MBU3110220.1 YitT family protein [Clostridium lacusfryxellense]
MTKINLNENILDFIFVALGCVLIAFSITSILRPNGLITGGITGVSIILEKLINIKYTYIYYVLSILVLAVAWISMGKREGIKIITLSIVFPFVLIVFERFNYTFIKNDLMLASVYFGLICGIGSGLVLKRGFSMGGTDTVAKILHHKIFTFVSISEILLCIDGTLIASSVIVYNSNIALYAIISQIIMVNMINAVMFGFGSKKVMLEIISDHNQDISQYIIHSIKRGVTSYEVKGGYKNLSRLKLQTLCSPRESMLIKRYIAETDPDAFIDVLPVISVWGKGVGFDRLSEK